MFKRVSYEEWMSVIPVIAFVVMFGVFFVTTIRAMRMTRNERHRLASLPLDEDSNHHNITL